MSNTVTINTPTEWILRVKDMRPGMMFALTNRPVAPALMCVTATVAGFRFINLMTGVSSAMEASSPVRRIFRVTVEAGDG